ncbi:MAG: 3-dehydroquinate synthase [Deltaproteobacteria bacterium]|nr:MAG: 3-dehydroquinate synthase [Deltaproteobacteria bacterium]
MKIEVELGGRSYPIHVIEGGLEGLGAAMRAALPPGPAVVVTNPVVGALYARDCVDSLSAAGFSPVVVQVPDGEAAKTVETWHRLVLDLLATGLRRTTPVVALGGGVTGDIAGFAAASALRGVPLVQVPTTLLSMVDSAVGGKTGVNVPAGKNLVGAFYQPRLVYAALDTLRTLDPAELRSGLGEVVKHGVLRDPALFALCEERAEDARGLDGEVVAEMVVRSCRVKAAVVAADERESGLRAILNLGHTVGHAIENVLGYGVLRHGECVGIGLVAETRWAAARGDCTADTARRVTDTVRRLGLPLAPPPVDREALIAAAGYDKKAARGMLATAVVERIGAVRLERVAFTEVPQMLAQIPAHLEMS